MPGFLHKLFNKFRGSRPNPVKNRPHIVQVPIESVRAIQINNNRVVLAKLTTIDQELKRYVRSARYPHGRYNSRIHARVENIITWESQIISAINLISFEHGVSINYALKFWNKKIVEYRSAHSPADTANYFNQIPGCIEYRLKRLNVHSVGAIVSTFHQHH